MPGMSFLLAPNSGPISPRPNPSIIPSQTLTVVKVNLEQDRPLGDDYAVRSLPCLLLFKDGEPAERFVGRAPYVILERGLAKHL